MTLAVPRMLFAFGRDGFLPRSVALVHPRFRTPHRAIVIQVLLIALLAGTGSFERLAIIANGSVLLVYAACCLATFELRRRDIRAGGVPFRVPAASLIPWLALTVIVALLATLRGGEWIAVLTVVGLAIPVYLFTRSRRSSVVVAAPVGD
jgi:APA family basic amino acid/polyamine antiporter